MSADHEGRGIGDIPGKGSAESDGAVAELRVAVAGDDREQSFGNVGGQTEFRRPILIEGRGLERELLAGHANAEFVQQARRESMGLVERGVAGAEVIVASV